MFSPIPGSLCLWTLPDLPFLCPWLHHNYPLLQSHRQCHKTSIWDNFSPENDDDSIGRFLMNAKAPYHEDRKGNQARKLGTSRPGWSSMRCLPSCLVRYKLKYCVSLQLHRFVLFLFGLRENILCGLAGWAKFTTFTENLFCKLPQGKVPKTFLWNPSVKGVSPPLFRAEV